MFRGHKALYGNTGEMVPATKNCISAPTREISVTRGPTKLRGVFKHKLRFVARLLRTTLKPNEVSR